MPQKNQNSVSVANLQLLKSIASRGLMVTMPSKGVTVKNACLLIENACLLIENATGIKVVGSMKISEVKELALFACAVYSDIGTNEMKKVMDIPMLSPRMKSYLKTQKPVLLS